MSLSNFGELKTLSHLFGGVPYTAPTTLYFALFTAAPGEAGGGTEVSGGSYARVAVAASSGMTVSGDTPTQVTNTNAINFPAATGVWGTVVAAGIFDASTGGNLIEYGTLSVSKTVGLNDNFSFPAGQYKITAD